MWLLAVVAHFQLFAVLVPLDAVLAAVYVRADGVRAVAAVRKGAL